MQWCSKEHVKSATALQTPHHRQQMLLGVGGGDRELSTVGRPGTNSNCVPDKAPEKAPADLLGVSFPEAQERREVGWIGVREEREGEEEKEGKRRMGDGLILGGGENEGGGVLHSAKDWAATCPPPPFPQWRETGGANPARLPLALKVQHPSPQAPGPATRAPIGKRLGASSDHQPFFFALFRTSRALVPTVPVVPVPVVPVPNLPFPFLAVARPTAIFDAAQSWVFFFSIGRHPVFLAARYPVACTVPTWCVNSYRQLPAAQGRRGAKRQTERPPGARGFQDVWWMRPSSLRLGGFAEVSGPGSTRIDRRASLPGEVGDRGQALVRGGPPAWGAGVCVVTVRILWSRHGATPTTATTVVASRGRRALAVPARSVWGRRGAGGGGRGQEERPGLQFVRGKYVTPRVMSTERRVQKHCRFKVI